MRAAYFDAAVVDAGPDRPAPDVVELLRSLDTGADRAAVLHRDGRWYARSADPSRERRGARRACRRWRHRARPAHSGSASTVNRPS